MIEVLNKQNGKIETPFIITTNLSNPTYKGEPGKTPVKGVDYFTATEIQQIEDATATKIDLSDYAKSADLATVAVSGSYNDLADKPTIPSTTGLATETYVDGKIAEIDIPTVPTNVSAFENDKGYLTEHQSLEGYAKKTDIPTVPTNVSAFTNDAGYLTEHQSLTEYAKKTDIPAPYTLPTASTSTLGGVKVDGSTITISNGVISSKGGSGNNIFIGAEEDQISYTKTFEDSSFTFNSKLFLDNENVKAKGYGYYKLSNLGKDTWMNGKAYYSTDNTTWVSLSGYVQGGSSPYGCSFNNLAFYVSGVENTIIITYLKGEVGASGLVPIPFDRDKVLSSNGDWITTTNVPTIKVGTGDNSEVFNYDNNKASGKYSHAEGYSTEATGQGSHAEGYGTQSSDSSHAEGYYVQAIGQGSHAEGYGGLSFTLMAQGSGSHAEGCAVGINRRAFSPGSHIEGYGDAQDSQSQQYARGNATHIEGYNTYCENSTTIASHAEGRATVAGSAYQHVEGKYNIIDTETAYQHITGNGTSHTERSNSYTLDWNGNAVFAGTVSNTGADYAEYFEWLDGNDNVDDRIGYIVALEGDKIRFANSEDDVLGIVSGTATVLGDNAEWEWQGKYLKDDFGRKIIDWVEHKTTTTIYNDDGTSQEKEISLGWFPEPRINPEYNVNEEYVNRESRPEWDTVGLIGKLFVRDNGNCQVGGYVKPVNGIATPTIDKTNMRVLKRVNENIIQVFLK